MLAIFYSFGKWPILGAVDQFRFTEIWSRAFPAFSRYPFFA